MARARRELKTLGLGENISMAKVRVHTNAAQMMGRMALSAEDIYSESCMADETKVSVNVSCGNLCLIDVDSNNVVHHYNIKPKFLCSYGSAISTCSVQEYKGGIRIVPRSFDNNTTLQVSSQSVVTCNGNIVMILKLIKALRDLLIAIVPNNSSQVLVNCYN